MAYSVEHIKEMTGQRVGTSRWFEVSQAMIDAHADIVQDHQFIHVDPVRAAETPFGGTIAHGFLTLSMLSAMAYDAQPEVEGTALGVNYGLNRLRFVTPVSAGARIRAHFTLKAVEERKSGEVTFAWDVEVEIEEHQKPALVAEWQQRRYLSAGEPE